MCSMYSSIAERSYVRPSSAVTGSSGSSNMMGQIQSSTTEMNAERIFISAVSLSAVSLSAVSLSGEARLREARLSGLTGAARLGGMSLTGAARLGGLSVGARE
eukprot:3350297-Prymnesium_polylepis.1